MPYVVPRNKIAPIAHRLTLLTWRRNPSFFRAISPLSLLPRPPNTLHTLDRLAKKMVHVQEKKDAFVTNSKVDRDPEIQVGADADPTTVDAVFGEATEGGTNYTSV